ncbi:MAG TPA: homocysteine S-methyltransferase family protein, partial [Terriglobales bacterium]|nr:homocysteine S-methyltransferase family protein [Terriglobales bacterium]
MSSDFLKRLAAGPILCDGAMGTLLYGKGIFINRCYDELNVSQPELIRGIHQEYLQAGADVIETNTFGANSFKLARHGFGERVREINLAGANLARQIVTRKETGQTFFVAGSVGPLGVRIEPLGKTSLEEARAAFHEQIAALVEGGVDVIFLETFTSLEEIHQAILAAREVNAEIPVVAMVTIDDEGNCLDGSTPETFAAKLTEWGADAIGCNCSVGPVVMLDAVEHMRRVSSLPLIAQPNAGPPQSVEGRNMYLCSPEYMASYARKLVAAGAQMVGGCCGTTPEHIKSMKSALRVGSAKGSGFQVVTEAAKKTEAAVPLLEQRSHLGTKIAKGEFVTMVEIVPPKGIDSSKEIEGARYLKSLGIDVINIPDSPRASARMSNQALSILVQQQVGVET